MLSAKLVPGHVFHDEIQISAVVANFINVNHVGMVEFGEDLGFLSLSDKLFVVGTGNVRDLNCHQPIQRLLSRLIHYAGGTTGQAVPETDSRGVRIR